MKNKFLTASLLFGALFVSTSVFAENNKKPFVIPEIQVWEGGEGVFTPNKKINLVIPVGNDSLRTIAQTFATDYERLLGKAMRVKEGNPSKGDICFTLANEGLGAEGYSIDIDKQVTIKASTVLGMFWGTRTILQLMEQSDTQSIPVGLIKDYPLSQKRGFMLDCGRKFFPLQYLEDCIKVMSYYKMNCFQVHLNDNAFKQYYNDDWSKTYSAFRLESETFPGLAAKDGHYTKKEFMALQDLATQYGVEIIPEIDAPAHTLAFTQYKPSIGSKEYGMDHLDLFNPETYEFMDALWKEYLGGENPVFKGKAVHIGTDEYSNKKKDVVEKFRYFTDHYIKYVESFGKQAYIWGALTHAKGDTPVKSENVIMSAWYNGYADPVEMVKQGYKLVSIPDGLLYIVPAAGYYYDYLNTAYLYNNWVPSQIGNAVFDKNDPNILGGMFAVWNDHAGNGISVKDVHHRVMPAMKTLSAKMWTGDNVTVPFDQFEQLSNKISEAPGVNVNAKLGDKPGMVYFAPAVTNRTKTELKEIGYPYTIEFEVTGKEEEKGAILFESENSTMYLSDPKDGKLGFSRDGYLFTFDYKVPQAEKCILTIIGDSKSTKLYRNGELVESLDILTHTFKNTKDKKKSVRTLVFPLQKAGKFESEIKDFRVYNYAKGVK